jgi:hypothetical protein
MSELDNVRRLVDVANRMTGDDGAFQVLTDQYGDTVVVADDWYGEYQTGITARLFNYVEGHGAVSSFYDDGALCGECQRFIYDNHYRQTYTVVNCDYVCEDCAADNPNDVIFSDGHDTGSTSEYLYANNKWAAWPFGWRALGNDWEESGHTENYDHLADGMQEVMFEYPHDFFVAVSQSGEYAFYRLTNEDVREYYSH